MNLLLIEEHEIDASGATARVTGRRLEHLRSVQRWNEGDVLHIGRVGGALGHGTITSLGADSAQIRVEWTSEPPPPLPCELVVALPRPPILRRTLYNATLMGVKKIHLVAASKVHRSYWQSRSLRPAAIRDQLMRGLEQAQDTRLPEVELHPYFKTFAAERLLDLVAKNHALVAHPQAADSCPGILPGPLTLFVGPEGGFNEFEIEHFEKVGARCVHLGPRVLRVDTAVTALLARIHPAE